MTVKIEDVRAGDNVTVEGVVVAKTDDYVRMQVGRGIHAWSLSLPISLIATHTPAPRPFKIGDTVRRHCDVGVCQLLAWFEGKAVLGRPGTNGRPTVLLADKSELLHADPAPAPQEAPAKEREKIEVWFNCYPNGSLFPADTRERADANATSDRIACLHVVGYEGDGL